MRRNYRRLPDTECLDAGYVARFLISEIINQLVKRGKTESAKIMAEASVGMCKTILISVLLRFLKKWRRAWRYSLERGEMFDREARLHSIAKEIWDDRHDLQNILNKNFEVWLDVVSVAAEKCTM